MNCQPNQLAYIRIPEGAFPDSVRAQMNGLVVVTVCVSHSEPFIWDIQPPARIVTDCNLRDLSGLVHPPGRLNIDGLPDRFLVPINGSPRLAGNSVRRTRFAVWRPRPQSQELA